MALPELTQKLVETKLAAYCHNKILAHARKQVRLSSTFWSNSVTLYEERAVYDSPGEWTKMPIAQFRLDVVTGLWQLHCANLKRRNGWLRYPNAEPAKDFDALLTALDQDRTGAFWG
jgi:hypothetical protein